MDTPRWKLDAIYPDFASERYENDIQALRDSVKNLGERISASRRDSDPLGWCADCLRFYNEADDLYSNLNSFAYARFSTNTKDTEAGKQLNRLEEIALPLRSALVSFRNRLAEIRDEVTDEAFREELVEALGDDYSFFLDEQLAFQKKQMSPVEEELSADLARAGGNAWTRQQEAVSSNLSTEWDGETGERKTVIQLRGLAFSPDRAIREKAYKLELEAWKQAEIPIAFSLNGVKGVANTLNTRRNFSDSLESPLMYSRISRKTLDALTGAMEEALPYFRRYMNAKAKYLGLEKLCFFDLFAPVGSSAKKWTYGEVQIYVEKQFSQFSPEMGSFAAKAFKEGWIDAESREGKVGGAYCTSFPISGESRILCNFEGSFSDLSTIAHELGHAYHHHVLKKDSAIHRDYPMTLAETASIFAQTLVFDAALGEAAESEKINVIEEFLQDCNQVIVDILSRFYFEKSVFEERKKAEISPDELCALMLDAQKRSYGGGLDPDCLHPYMWAAKPHYYRHELGFYNFPYAFGLLFGLGLFSRYQTEGESFVPVYDDILKSTARGTANQVTAQAGFDIESKEFWLSGIGQIGKYIDEFEKIVASSA